jgi:hypothetical protein
MNSSSSDDAVGRARYEVAWNIPQCFRYVGIQCDDAEGGLVPLEGSDQPLKGVCWQPATFDEIDDLDE